jgi:autotransporter passenger strand-loop-strand repeat protein
VCGSASNTAIASGGDQYVESGGQTIDVIDGGSQTVYSSAVARNASATAGGALYVSGGLTSDTTVLSGGSEFVYRGVVTRASLASWPLGRTYQAISNN